MIRTSSRQKIALILFGVTTSLILLEAALRLGGYIFLTLQEHRNRASIARGGTYRILCLGESTTAYGGEDSYPSQLERILNSRNLGVKFSVINKGVPAITTGSILKNLSANLDTYSPNMVITMMGINDGVLDKAFQPPSDEAPRAVAFLKDLRVYKLIGLLRARIMNRAQISPKRDQFAYFESAIHYKTRGEFDRAEEMLKKAIWQNAGDMTARFELAVLYGDTGRFDEAEDTFKKILKADPRHEGTFREWERFSRDNEKLPELEKIFRGIIDSDPKNELACYWLGQTYFDLNKLKEAKEAFEKAVAIKPGYGAAYVDLGRCYAAEGRFKEAEAAFGKAVDLNQDVDTHVAAAFFYDNQNRFEEARSSFEKALALHPPHHVYLAAEKFYRSYGKKDEADRVLKDTLAAIESDIKNDPANDRLYKLLVQLCEELGDVALKEAYRAKYEFSKSNTYNNVTRHNYQRLKQVVSGRGIRLVSVQYPMRSVEPLKKMLDAGGEVTFVDNEKIFQDTLKNAPYDECFEDRFGGDFGHCTPEGNRLLAENIADSIARENQSQFHFQ